MNDTMAVYAGSFNPITNGHMWMILKGVAIFGRLTVAIAVNPKKNPPSTSKLDCK